MKVELPFTGFHDPKQEQQQRFIRFLSITFGILGLWLLIPEAAWAADLDFPIVDELMCGFIKYSKTKLAPYVAVLAIIIGVVGHWLGATKVWGTILYVAIGLGIIGGIGAAIATATGGTGCT